MKCHWTQDALCCWVFKLLKVVKGGKLPKDLAAWSKRRNQIGRAVLPKRWCRSYTRHHPCHKMSQGRRSPYYWHLRTVPSLIAVIAQATQYRFYRLKSFSSIPSLHFDSRTLVPLVQIDTLPAMAPAVGCSQASNSSCSEPGSGIGMVYCNMIQILSHKMI